MHDLSEPFLTLPASTLFGEQELNLLTELHLFIAGSDRSAPCDLCIYPASLLRSPSVLWGEEILAGSLLRLSPQDWLHPFPSPKPRTYFSTACRAAREAKQRLYLETQEPESGPKADQG